jgi:rubrerythrin
MRESLLGRDPQIDRLDMHALVGIANAMEQESINRYALLAELMAQRGEAATAAAFRAMRDEERAHAEAVARLAGRLHETVPPPGEFAWRLPPDLADSWDEIAGSALLTPYRAFALAVENEQRAFTFYSYLAARAVDDRVMNEAERLAGEELRHAALMRRFRRRAYHDARREGSRQAPPRREAVATVEALHRLLEEHETAIAHEHRVIADRLREIGDDESAELLDGLLEMSSRPASVRARSSLQVDAARGATQAATQAATPAAPPGAAAPAGTEAGAAPANEVPVQLLVAAQRPLERFAESLEAVMRTSEGALFAEAERAIGSVFTRLTRVSLQAGKRLQAPVPPGTALG